MIDKNTGFFAAAWQRLRPHALATFVDIGQNLILWMGVVCISLIRIAVTAIGVEPELMKPVHWMELGAHLILFASLFFRIVLRAIRGAGA